MDTKVIPLLPGHDRAAIRTHSIRLFGVPEKTADIALPPAAARSGNPAVTLRPGEGEVELRVTAAGGTFAECDKLADPVLNQITEKFKNQVYGIDVPNLQTALVQALDARKMQIATAESCTGGMLSERITEVPGSSAVFECGICSYSDAVKHRVLGVDTRTLEKYGAVSAETALEMAAGARKLAGADIAVSTTGLAGPDGDGSDKPVGTVFFAVDTPGAAVVRELHLDASGPEGRDRVRRMATKHALFAALRAVQNGGQADCE